MAGRIKENVQKQRKHNEHNQGKRTEQIKENVTNKIKENVIYYVVSILKTKKKKN